MKTIKVKDFIENECEHLHCTNNQLGSCKLNDVDFLADIIEDFIIDKKREFECNYFEVKEGHCSECGSELIEVNENDESWGKNYIHKIFECSRGC